MKEAIDVVLALIPNLGEALAFLASQGEIKPGVSSIFPGWKPPYPRDTDVWVLVKAELFTEGRFIRVCESQQILPSILRASLIASAPETFDKTVKQILCTPLRAEFLDIVDNATTRLAQGTLSSEGLSRKDQS